MQVGTSLRSGYAAIEAHLGALHMIEQARAARDADLDSLFVGDHHSTGPFPYYQNIPIMGRLLAEWGERTAGVLLLLPLWDPVLAAEQLGTLASIHQGSFVLQCAIGAGESQFGALGVDLRERRDRFEACLGAILRLLAGETVEMTEPYSFGPARIAPGLASALSVWIGASAPQAIDRAARLGDVFLVGPEATPSEATRQLDVFRERRAVHGREVGCVAIRRDIHIAANSGEAAAVAEHVLKSGYRGFDPTAVIIGEVATVVEEFALLGHAGFSDVIVRHLVDDQSAVLRSFERLAEVRSVLRDL